MKIKNGINTVLIRFISLSYNKKYFCTTIEEKNGLIKTKNRLEWFRSHIKKPRIFYYPRLLL